jgi:hypothetical protein
VTDLDPHAMPRGLHGEPLLTPTASPQSAAVKAAQLVAQASAIAAKYGTLPVEPAVRVHDVDGVPTITPRRPLGQGVNPIGQLVSDEELAAMGQPRRRMPVCDFPGCNNESSEKLMVVSGRPVSINRKGELVAGDFEPLDEFGMSANDRARAQLGMGVIGPSNVPPARLTPKNYVDVCHLHRGLPLAAPKRKPKPTPRYVSGPYGGMHLAMARASVVNIRARAEVAKAEPVNAEGREVWVVVGDDGQGDFAGKLHRLPEDWKPAGPSLGMVAAR